MRNFTPWMAGACLLAMGAVAGADPLTGTNGATRGETAILLAQATQPEAKKDETLKHKVKRVWRNWTGYKFDVACPAVIPLSHKTCTQTGKNEAEARAKCESAHPLCSVARIR